MRRLTHILCAALLAASPAAAEGFSQIQSRDAFLSVISDKKLTRLGINLVVTPSGQIAGRAFGRDVSGAWRWQSGYFCRDLYWGERNLGANCQAVKVDGQTIRFISDRGAGDYADLTLR
ncbi:dihydrodipicolinate reductase [Roseovarius aestuariivivens]|uniref:dihydrodipicolinate reductase n=1 Tax=Roseovarius aestuariivivens TaxID=1888910 RepID=UPI001081B1AA|nr:dihydrodipicolinate reductase [Roseovarius aestuariivivens]